MFTLLAENLHFGEGPRWHNNKLWFSDFYQHSVMTLDLAGKIEKIVEIPNQPSGLGWLPNGDLLIVSMLDRKIMKYSNNELSLHSDLSKLTPFRCNDMVVDKDGDAYVGNFGSLHHARDVKPTCLIHVDPQGNAEIAAKKLDFPNGTVITPDGKKMIIGETYAGRLTSFDIGLDKRLSNRKVWAKMMPTWYYIGVRFALATIYKLLNLQVKEGSITPFPVPDGICLDEGNGVWVASPTTSEVIRFEEGGVITDRLATPDRAYACMLGGDDGKTLFVITGKSSIPEEAQSEKNGKIYTTLVKFARAGYP